ncbi:MAG: hypothetical protein ACI9IV_002332 [Paracoccaceae bacterium]|jgi:hypothetical protein|tara:strand:- start:295 stop:501 length:207 start_codon:yes stop_codon:yes gene_type:complete
MQDDWIRRVDQRLHALETRNAVEEVHRVAVEKRLGSIEDTLNWLVRLVIGALVIAVVTYALRGGFAAM